MFSWLLHKLYGFIQKSKLIVLLFHTSLLWELNEHFFGVVNSCLYCCFLTPKPYLTLCSSMDCSLPGSSVLGISQARILEWVAIFLSGDCPNPGIEPRSPALAGRFFTTDQPGKPLNSCLSIYLFYTLEMSSTWIYGNISGKIKTWLSSNSKLKLFVYSSWAMDN